MITPELLAAVGLIEAILAAGEELAKDAPAIIADVRAVLADIRAGGPLKETPPPADEGMRIGLEADMALAAKFGPPGAK